MRTHRGCHNLKVKGVLIPSATCDVPAPNTDVNQGPYCQAQRSLLATRCYKVGGKY